MKLTVAKHTGPVELSNIHIASPCPADWEKMVGDERVRHCAECNLNVYNLSAMTERQVLELIEDNRGKRICTRFYRRADGTILTQDCPWGLRALKRRASRVASDSVGCDDEHRRRIRQESFAAVAEPASRKPSSQSWSMDHGLGSTRRACSRGRSALN